MQRLARLAQDAEQEMRWAGIFGPDWGDRGDIPTVLLDQSFTAESQNCILRYKEVRRAKMRLPELVQAVFTAGTVGVTNGSPTVTLSNAGWAGGDNHKPDWTDRSISITDSGSTVRTYGISAVTYDAANSEITLDDNYEGATEAGLSYQISVGDDEVGAKVQAPDGNTILHYHTLVVTNTGTEYLFAFTKAHAYLWSSSWSAFILKFTCGSDCLQWDTATFNDKLIATNNVDLVQVWGATVADLFAVLDDANGLDTGGGVYVKKAKYVIEYEGYLIVGNIDINGVRKANNFKCCKYGDETTWDSSDAVLKVIRGGGELRGFGKWGGYLVIAQASQIRYLWHVEGAEIFRIDEFDSALGCIAAHSIVTDKEGRLYFLATDYTYRRLPGFEIVSDPKDKVFKNINPELEEYIEAAFIDETGQIVLSVPATGVATANNKILTVETRGLRWGELDMAVAAFGEYTRQEAYTIDTIPFGSIDAIGWESIDAIENIPGFPLDLCSDYSGYTYTMYGAEKDAGEDYTGYFVINTSLLMQEVDKRYGLGLRRKKRLEAMKVWLYSGGAGDEFTVSVKCDTEPAWSACDAVSLAGTAEILELDVTGVDFRARNFLIKGSATNKFRFVGIELGFVDDGGD